MNLHERDTGSLDFHFRMSGRTAPRVQNFLRRQSVTARDTDKDKRGRAELGHEF